jgi:alcohol dehydrogenase
MNIPYNITTYETHTRIILGFDSIRRLTDELKKMPSGKIMVLADKHVNQTEFYQKCLKYIQESGFPYVTFDGILPEAPVAMVMKACELIVKEKCELLIAIGGGSCIDLAKAAGVMATNGGKPQDHAGYDVFKIPPLPLIAIPTTAGTSSEVTAMAIIHDEETDVKFTIAHREFICPKIAILDPQCLESCPPKVVAEAGIDAFTHAFESFISLRANPCTEALSLQGIKLISKNLRALYADRKNINAAANMLVACTMGGMAFTTTGTGNIHCVGRFIGPKFHLSHGLTNGILLPVVARFNHPACPGKYAQIAQAMEVDVQGLSELEAGEAAIKAIEKLCSDLDIPKKLRELGCKEVDFEPLAEDCWKAYTRMYQYINPRQTSKNDYITIMKEAF